jgi:hypothetical protein
MLQCNGRPPSPRLLIVEAGMSSMTDRCFHFGKRMRPFDSIRQQSGFEGAIGGQWTAKLEYLDVDLGTVNGGLGAFAPLAISSHVTDNSVRLGELLLQFGSFSTCTMPLMTRRSSARSTPRLLGAVFATHMRDLPAVIFRVAIRSVRGANRNARVSSRGSTDLRSKWAAVAQPPGCRSRAQIPVPSMELPRIRPRFSVQAKSRKTLSCFQQCRC